MTAKTYHENPRIYSETMPSAAIRDTTTPAN